MKIFADKSFYEDSKNSEFFLLLVSEDNCDIRSSIKDWLNLSLFSDLLQMIQIVVSKLHDRLQFEKS